MGRGHRHAEVGGVRRGASEEQREGAVSGATAGPSCFAPERSSRLLSCGCLGRPTPAGPPSAPHAVRPRACWAPRRSRPLGVEGRAPRAVEEPSEERRSGGGEYHSTPCRRAISAAGRRCRGHRQAHPLVSGHPPLSGRGVPRVRGRGAASPAPLPAPALGSLDLVGVGRGAVEPVSGEGGILGPPGPRTQPESGAPRSGSRTAGPRASRLPDPALTRERGVPWPAGHRRETEAPGLHATLGPGLGLGVPGSGGPAGLPAPGACCPALGSCRGHC